MIDLKTVHEVSLIAGISVRTLHHYDSIGLLKPTMKTEAGYRLYDDNAMTRLHSILMFRELGFSLSDIKSIMDSPGFDFQTALRQHMEMLTLQRDRIENLIEETEKLMKGENADFSAFDRSKMEKYEEEVKQKWEKTAEYREYTEKAGTRNKEQNKEITDGLMKLFSEFGMIRETSPDSEEAAEAVKKLQEYLSAHYFSCSDVMLRNLGEMYVADERFKTNIDREGGPGTAQFVREAIRNYTRIS